MLESFRLPAAGAGSDRLSNPETGDPQETAGKFQVMVGKFRAGRAAGSGWLASQDLPDGAAMPLQDHDWQWPGRPQPWRGRTPSRAEAHRLLPGPGN